ncbi:response regulator [Mucilaginibacter sp. HD30]
MRKRILVIDDDEDILEILHIIFQDEGYNVVISNSSDAVDRIHEISPDLILLDINIKGSAKNGAEICAEVKEHYPKRQTPVILISAESDISIIAKECGADSFVRKPFDIYQLLMQVKDFIN